MCNLNKKGDNMTTKQDWMNLVDQLLTYKGKDYSNKRCPKIHNFSYDMDPPDDSFQLDEVYKACRSKMAKLNKYYFNPESLEEAKQDLEKGDQLVSFILQNKKKEQGGKFCMVGGVVDKVGKHYELTIYYRSIEPFRKFFADLYFFREVLIPEIPVEITKVHLRIARISLDPKFMWNYLIAKFGDDLKAAIEYLREADPDMLTNFMRFVKSTYYYEESDDLYHSIARQLGYFQNTPMFLNSDVKGILDEYDTTKISD